jgi:hypothetical protein
VPLLKSDEGRVLLKRTDRSMDGQKWKMERLENWRESWKDGEFMYFLKGNQLRWDWILRKTNTNDF